MTERERRWKEYAGVPAEALGRRTRQIMYMDLNVPAPIRNSLGQWADYRGLSNMLNLCYELFDNIQNDLNPAKTILSNWIQQATVQRLFECLELLERPDIIRDIRTRVDHDVRQYRKKYPPGSPIEPRHVDTPVYGEQRYDAFVSYCDEDFGFVQELIKLEEKCGIKLCIPERDLLVGPVQEMTAQMIEDRCHKTLVIISEDYIKSDECRFEIRYAMALPQDAGIKKIIPIIVGPCAQIPSMLNFMTLIDYTKEELRQWFWPRLVNTIKDLPNTNHLQPYRGDMSAIKLPTKKLLHRNKYHSQRSQSQDSADSGIDEREIVFNLSL